MPLIEGAARPKQVSEKEEERLKKQSVFPQIQESSVARMVTKTYVAPQVSLTPNVGSKITREGPEHATNIIETRTVTTTTPKQKEVPTSLFGPKTSWYDPKTGEFKEELTTRQGEKVYVTTYSRSPTAVRGASPFESMAVSGLGLSTTMASGIANPLLGASSVVGVSGVEAVKYGVTGQHLTVEEAIGVAGVSQLAFVAGSKAYPYLKSGASKLYTKLMPERAMYNRVVLQENMKALTVSDRFKAFFNPKEAAMFQRTQPIVKQTVPKASFDPFKSTGGFSKTSAGKWVQQQVLLKPQTKQVTVKPFSAPQLLKSAKAVTLTSTAVTPKVATKVTAKSTVKVTSASKMAEKVVGKTTFSAPTIQIQNPFLKYKGRSYYGERYREEDYAYPIVYPAGSPLQSPAFISRITDVSFPTQLPSEIVGAGQTLLPDLTQIQKDILTTDTVERAVQTSTLKQQQLLKESQLPKIPYFSVGGGASSLVPTRRGWSRWYPRTHKVKTWEAQAKDFLGLKVPKKFSRMMNVEGFGDLKIVAFGKTLKGKKKKRKKRRSQPRLKLF